VQGAARVKPSEFPARRVVERASQRGSRRHGSNRAGANESGSVRLGGTFKDAAWVKPSRDRERHQKEELPGEIHRDGEGKTEPASREWRREAAASRINQKRATRVKPSRPYFFGSQCLAGKAEAEEKALSQRAQRKSTLRKIRAGQAEVTEKSNPGARHLWQSKEFGLGKAPAADGGRYKGAGTPIVAASARRRRKAAPTRTNRAAHREFERGLTRWLKNIDMGGGGAYCSASSLSGPAIQANPRNL